MCELDADTARTLSTTHVTTIKRHLDPLDFLSACFGDERALDDTAQRMVEQRVSHLARFLRRDALAMALRLSLRFF